MKSSIARRNCLRGELLKKKGLSMRGWAQRHGLKPNAAQIAIYRAIDQNRRPRKGSKALAILEELEADLGIKICG